MKKTIWILVLVGGWMQYCHKAMPKAPDNAEILDGPISDLSYHETQQFLAGDAAFNNVIFTSQNGLGPIFVASSCGACHAGDGKGHPSTQLTRFGQNDSLGNQFIQEGGPQLQNRAIPGYVPETLPLGVSSTKLVAPANTGLGYLDAVSDADILALSDPNDLNGDGISGTANWIKVPSYCQLRPGAIQQNGKYIGRFGKKAAAYDLLQQTANAYNQDMGIASNFEPIDTYSKLKIQAEISDASVHQVVFYLKTLKAPIQRQANQSQVEAGKNLFIRIGCESCHKAELKTSSSSIQALSNKIFHPYTDLLLHDMGPDLDDHYTEGSAKTYEWRTPALWGLGLSKDSQGGTYFLMHDGRAHSIESAILLHHGEAENSRIKYTQLSANEQNQLIQFLESL